MVGRKDLKGGIRKRIFGNLTKLAVVRGILSTVLGTVTYSAGHLVSLFGTSRRDVLNVLEGESEITLQFARQGLLGMAPEDIRYGVDLREESDRERELKRWFVSGDPDLFS